MFWAFLLFNMIHLWLMLVGSNVCWYLSPSGLLQPFCLPQRKALGLKEPTIVERHGRSDVPRNMDDFNSFWPLGFRLGSR